AERRDAVALLQAERLQRRGELPRPRVVLAVAVPAKRLVGQARDDLVAREQLAGAVEQVVERERNVHHRRAHGGLPVQCAARASRAATAASYSSFSIDSTTSES